MSVSDRNNNNQSQQQFSSGGSVSGSAKQNINDTNGAGGGSNVKSPGLGGHNPHRQWQAALNLLWAASHLGHNATDLPIGGHESLGPSQSGGLQLDVATGGFKPSSHAGGPSNLSEFLRTVPHFYLLPLAQLNRLADFGLRRDFLPGEIILEHEAEVAHVRVILAGVVDVVDRNHGTVGTMEACSVFGFDSIIVQEKAPFRFVCSRACSLLLLPAAEVLRILQKSSQLRQSIGRKMSGQMNCFRTLKEFSRLLFSHDAMKYEYIPLQAILESYGLMTDSVVHTLKSRREIDTTAWYYAIQRLPENITRVFSLDLVRSLPPFLATRMRSLTRKAERAIRQTSDQSTLAHADPHNNSGTYAGNFPSSIRPSPPHMGSPQTNGGFPTSSFNANTTSGVFETSFNQATTAQSLYQAQYNDYRSRDIRYVHTSQRRRCVWQLGIDGKNIVLMRDDFTDYLDFVLSLSIHIVESSKLRGRLQSIVSPSAIDVIEGNMMKAQMMAQQQLLQSQQQQQQQQQAHPTHNKSVSVDDTRSMMQRTQSGIPITLANATGYNGIRDITGANHSISQPPTPLISSPLDRQHQQQGKGTSSTGATTPIGGASPAAQGFTNEQLEDILQNQLCLSEEETKGMISIWGSSTLLHLHDVLMHREEYLLRADSSVARRFQSDPFHDWALGVRGAVVRRLELDPQSPLPTDLTIDLVFGLTRSFLNCLSPCARLYRDEIIEYGHTTHPEVMSQPWNCEEDMLYVLIPDFLNENPDMRATFNSVLDECGIEVLEDTALTGLQADIICADLLDHGNLDELLRQTLLHSPGNNNNVNGARFNGSNTNNKQFSSPVNNNTTMPTNHAASVEFDTNAGSAGNNNNNQNNKNGGAHFLINIDYTFGAQAEGILKTLVTLFGTRIRSVNVLGKIAGFKGNRAGDIIIADNVVASKMSLTSEDHMDEIRTINNQGLRMERVQEYLGSATKRKCRRGSVLTVATAMLCDSSIISYYKNIWNCVGFEIEGSYFARMVKECKSNGLLQQDLPTRHMYLVRELPEEADGSSTFAQPRYAGEVLSAQYAIARSILELILRRDYHGGSNGNSNGGGHGMMDASASNSSAPTGIRHAHFATGNNNFGAGGFMSRTETAPVGRFQ